jgi:hypothetical protein
MTAAGASTEQRARARAIAATARTVSGVAVALGLLGVLNTGLDELGSDSAETLFVFLVHPLTAIAWLLIGLVGIPMATETERARRFLAVVGALLLAWALLAVAAGDGATQMLTRDRELIVLHLVGGAVSLLVAVGPLPAILTRALGRAPGGDPAAGERRAGP